MKTLKELLEAAERAKGMLPIIEANRDLSIRLSPATMRLVLEALTLAKQLVDGPLDCPPRPSAVHKAVVSALAALNGASHGEQGEGAKS